VGRSIPSAAGEGTAAS